MYITKFLSLSETHFRSAYSINAVAKIDKTGNVVCVDSRLSFRIFKVSGKMNSFIADYRDENRIINISCNEWLDAGSGVAILIAKQ